MSKASIYIVIFLISVNAGAVMLMSTGVAGDLGVSPSQDRTGRLSQAESTAEDYSASSSGGSTLFGLYGSLASTLDTIFNVVPAVGMVKRAGVPDFYANFAFTFLTMIPAFDLIAFLRSGGTLL